MFILGDIVITRSYKIIGRVQGVGFRYRTWEKALDLGLNGYVQNNYDDSVSCVIQGSDTAVMEMEEWLAQGPSYAFVEKLIRVEDKEIKNYDQFTICR